ncbi:MAG TPA: ABC transporter permease [Candidatus Acidoferrales bacterium]|nr:ABC transporter permease [Candidatus Acidoferrales bacterium]
MRNAWTLTKVRMHLALRNRAFIFFSLIFPLIFLFLFLGLFARSNTAAVPYMLASVLAITVMGSFWGLSVQLVTFREQGILRRFRIAPVGPGAMLASSILSNYILTLPTVAIEFLLARRVFHMSEWGNVGGIFLLVTLGIVTFAALGLIIASVTNSTQETQVINQILWSAFLFLSGATLPLPMLPVWLQRFALFLPATYLVTGFERVMVGRVGVTHIGAEIIALAVSAFLAFFLSQQLFRWEPEAKVGTRAKVLGAATIVPFLLLGLWESTQGNLRATARTDFLSMEGKNPAPLSVPR